MNFKILSVFLASFLLGACASEPVTLNPQLADCPSQGRWWCRGDGLAPTIKIMTGGKRLRVSPYCANVKDRSELLFMILPRGSQAEGTVEIIAKDPADSWWLHGTNSPRQNFIFIKVPPNIDADKKYGYGIKIDGKCLDPRVHVEN